MVFTRLTTALIAIGGIAPFLAMASPANACGETSARVCYGRDGGESQDISVDDVKYVASSLRLLGRQNKGDGLAAMWTMESDAATRGADCQEWILPVSGSGTVLALAKHINGRINSSVLFSDMADAIDGGQNADEEAQEAALLGCGTGGGMMGVKTDPNNPEYATDEYLARNYKPEGILIKLVKAPEIPNAVEELDEEEEEEEVEE